jgi:hypothetical protein
MDERFVRDAAEHYDRRQRDNSNGQPNSTSLQLKIRCLDNRLAIICEVGATSRKTGQFSALQDRVAAPLFDRTIRRSIGGWRRALSSRDQYDCARFNASSR